MKKKLLWALLFSVIFMVFLLSRIEWNHFSLIVAKVDIMGLFFAFVVFLSGNLVRTFRFCKLDHFNNNPSYWWNINAFYNLITATLPGGSGEAATIYALKRFSMFGILSAFRIMLLSRLMDLFAISLLFFISAIFISNLTPYRETAIWIAGILFLFSLVSLIPASERFIIGCIQKIPAKNMLLNRMSERLSELQRISKEHRTKNSYSITLFYSVLMMILGFISVHLLLRSFGIDFTPLQSAYCYGIYMIFQIVPVQGIAGIGTQAAWWALALKVSGYRAPDLVALGFILHGTFYLFIALIGLSALLFCFVLHRINRQ